MIVYVIYIMAGTIISGVWIGVIASIAYTVFKWLTKPRGYK